MDQSFLTFESLLEKCLHIGSLLFNSSSFSLRCRPGSGRLHLTLSNMFGEAFRIPFRLKLGFFLGFFVIIFVTLSSSVASQEALSVESPALPDVATEAPATAAQVPLAERSLPKVDGREDHGDNEEEGEEEEGLVVSSQEERPALPRMKGIRTTFAAVTMMLIFLIAHFLSVKTEDLSEIDNLSLYENRHLASAIMLAGMLFSGLGDMLASYRLRLNAKNGVYTPKWKGLDKRGKPQMALGAVLYMAMIASALSLGTFGGVPTLVSQAISVFAAGLFYWGAALYVDPWGLGNDDD